MKQYFSGLKEKFKNLPGASTPAPEAGSTKNPLHIAIDPHGKDKIELNIPTSQVLKVLIVFALFVLALQGVIMLKSILILVAVSLFLTLGLTPAVDWLERWLPRPLAILLLYVLFLGVLGIIFVRIIPIIALQLQQIAGSTRTFFESQSINEGWLGQVTSFLSLDSPEIQALFTDNLSSLSDSLQGLAGSTVSVLSGVFSGVTNFVFAMGLLFFMLLEREQIGRFFLLIFESKNRPYIEQKTRQVQNKVAKWFRGQIILMLSIGIGMWVGMFVIDKIFGLPYAETIGLLAGLMELFPYIGVMITGLVATLIAMNVSWAAVLAVVVWLFILQFLEGNILVPMVMEKVVGLPSTVIILALAMGGVLGFAMGGITLSILGMILAVPVAASVAIFVQEFLDDREALAALESEQKRVDPLDPQKS